MTSSKYIGIDVHKDSISIEHSLRTLKELVRSYLTITKDLARVCLRWERLAVAPI